MFKRALQLCLLVVAAFTMLGAGDPATRFDQIGHQLVCQCGCTQILLECNHVGCPVSPVMIDELHREIATLLPNAGIFNWFAAKYGPVVLAAPMQGGFDIVAWIVPFAALGLGILAVIFTLKVWQRRAARLTPTSAPPPTPAATAMRDRIRSETRYGE